MIIELHILQNFAPSCLNRDDMNAPKDCYFGGKRRARISSQCFKRAARMNPDFAESLSHSVGTRTRLLQVALLEWFETKGKDREESAKVVNPVVSRIGSGLDEKDRTSIGLYLGQDEIKRIGESIEAKYDELLEAAAEEDTEKEGKKGKKARKGAGSSAVQEVAETISKSFVPGTKAADVALFGRMIAEATHFNVDASAQVAHALSTNSVDLEYDYFTAVDDLQPKGDPGAGMIGIQQFNSACFYRYANVHLPQLAENLGDDLELARESALAFIKSFITAIPPAKQNSHAAHNPPDFVMAVVRTGGAPLSLANAFAKPVRPKGDKDLVGESVAQLISYYNSLVEAYGSDGVAAIPYFAVGEKMNGSRITNKEPVSGLKGLLDTIRKELDAWTPKESVR